MDKIKEARVKKWARALRSGKYAQTRGKLKDNSGYCCLGVACDVYRKETGEGEWAADAGGFSGPGFAFTLPDGTRETGSLPEKVAKWFGLKTDDGRYREGRHAAEQTSLIAHNDDHHDDFKTIADVIEGKRAFSKRTSLFGRFER